MLRKPWGKKTNNESLVRFKLKQPETKGFRQLPAATACLEIWLPWLKNHLGAILGPFLKP